ncbi:MAG TPA: hypothetical protein VKY31_09395, partial [Terriglobia bacterium]|nr:hypothetical protein [Terriglobia bacterium]
GVLRYQSGDLIRSPASNNAVTTFLGRDFRNNPALWGGAATLQNKVSNQYLAKDPNCHCIDVLHDLVLNPGAWSDAQPGTYGTAAPYYNDFRWQRKPSEALSVGRYFNLAKEDKVRLQVRAEFQNVFNRLFLPSPSATNPSAITTQNGFGQLTGGYGYINAVNGAGTIPRSGQIVARLIF